MLATGVTMGLTEWIIDDTSLVSTLFLLINRFDLLATIVNNGIPVESMPFYTCLADDREYLKLVIIVVFIKLYTA